MKQLQLVKYIGRNTSAHFPITEKTEEAFAHSLMLDFSFFSLVAIFLGSKKEDNVVPINDDLLSKADRQTDRQTEAIKRKRNYFTPHHHHISDLQ